METWRVPFEMAEVGSTTDRPRFIVRLSEFSEPTSAHKLTIASDILLRESYVAADVYACVCGPVLVTRCGFRIVEACLLCSTTVEIAQVTCLAGTNQFVGSRRLRNITAIATTTVTITTYQVFNSIEGAHFITIHSISSTLEENRYETGDSRAPDPYFGGHTALPTSLRRLCHALLLIVRGEGRAPEVTVRKSARFDEFENLNFGG